jgi:hypothetical protein
VTSSNEYAREIGGALPDGTPYTLAFETPVDPAVQGAGAVIMLDQADGSSRVLGRTVIITDGKVEPGLDAQNRYGIASGQGGGVTISVFDEVADLYPDLESFLDGAIKPGTGSNVPNLELSPPLRWATDDEVAVQMQVAYEGFVVQRGCGELAAACNDTGTVQVISDDKVFSGSTGLRSNTVLIYSPRAGDSLGYLDPGPLGIRGNHDVLWTGKEMIVWGGADGDRVPNLIDGAAFDPDTSTWRMLSPVPLDKPTVTRAVWTEDIMVVVTREATFGYDPGADVWSPIGDGLYPPENQGLVVWTGDLLAAWTQSGIHLFDLDIGVWTQLPDPGFGTGEPWTSALRVIDGTLYAIGSAGLCGGRRAAYWGGASWVSLPRVELDGGEYADCSSPNQTGVTGGRLVVWDSDMYETVAYDPGADEWSPIATIPLSGSDFPSGPLELENGFLVPQWGEAAIFDNAARSWTNAQLPGNGWSSEMVWTGDEVLMWGQACCYGSWRDEFVSMDAWRWTPPG